MTTYEIPDEPDVCDLWGPSPDGEGWNYYRRSKGVGQRRYWHRWEYGEAQAGPYTWVDLLQMGPLTDEDPDPPLMVLANRVVAAATTWAAGEDGPFITRAAREADLLSAVYDYNKKKGTG